VLVIGAGAIGGITAGLMTGSVERVAVLDVNEQHVARLRDAGLLLERDGGSDRIAIEAYSSPEQLDGEFDFGLIALKAPAIAAALGPLADLDIVRTYVSLGNGLVQDRIAAIVGADRLLVGTVEWGATNLGPGHLRRTTDNPFVIGELDGRDSERVRALARVLEPVAAVRVTGDIQSQLWSKLLVNSTLSGLGVVGGCTYAEVAGDERGRRAVFAVWAEGHDLGVAQGLALEPVLGIEAAELASDDHAVRERALATVVECAGATKASMLQDVERGLPTEVDVINGAVVQRAAELGREAPLNARIVRLVHEFERGERAPSREHFAELCS
jgi:2-dehydropantoate 2-reductase